MSSVKGDPVDWTVQEVIEFLCHSAEAPWSQSATKSPRPDPTAFEAILRENMITGEVLLNDVDKETLRDDLGLKAIGPRSSVLMAIRYLRQSSLKYQHSQSSHRSAFDGHHDAYGTPRPESLTAPFHNPFSRAVTTHQGASSMAASGSAQHSSKEANSTDLSPSNNFQMDQNYFAPESLQQGEIPNGESLWPSKSVPGDSSQSPRPGKRISADPDTQIRSGEHFIVDNRGRKRRRLELGPSNEIQTGPRPSKGTDPSLDRTWYMGPDRISPSEIFYPLDADEDGESFIIYTSRFPTAQSRFVNKSLNFFYKQRPFKLSGRKGDSQWGLFPYKPENVHRSSPRYFTLYTSRNGQTSVTQENIEDWSQLIELQAAGSETSSPDPFSYLMEKYPAEEGDGEAHPLYGDSDFEDYDTETLQEIEAEEKNPTPKEPPKFGAAEVDSIIGQAIAEYENKWQRDHRPMEEQKARHFWRMTRKGKCTNQKINALTHCIASLDDRLRKLAHEVRIVEHESRSQLKTLCRSMEQTVFQIQKEKFRVSVLEQETCPPKVAVAPRPRRAPKPKDNDEESLYSESDGFIDDESSQADSFDNPEVVELPKTPNMSSASSDDDVVIPSPIRRKSRARRGVNSAAWKQELSPAIPEDGKAVEYPIDLTQDSPAPEDLTIETPPLNPVESKITPPGDTSCGSRRKSSVSPMPCDESEASTVIHNPKPPQGGSEADSSDETSSMSIETIEERQDRCKLLGKLVSALPINERKRLAESVPGYDMRHLQELVKNALNEILSKSFEPSDWECGDGMIVMRTLSLFVSWITCRRHGIQGIAKTHVSQAIEGIDGFPNFFRLLCKRLKSDRPKTQGDLEREETRSPSTQQVPNTPHKKRKREIKESQDAKRRQADAMERVAVQGEQRKALEQKMARMGVSNGDPTHQAVSFGTPAIYLDPHIGRCVKPHQLKGIQFMWRELIEDEKQQGCLLAHTMGLGKTMQVISLLATIAASASSNDDNIRKQVPEGLRRSRTLIICPSSLIENWYEEFLMWTPRQINIGHLRTITSAKTLEERLQEAFEWDRDGGILILSYNIFQALVHNSTTKAGKKRLEDDVHRRIKGCLLNGPNIIVADEAHKMKNPASRTAVAAKQFRSKRRIALTGSPLANNLVDYFTMVDWIAPGYLGEFVDFKANYEEPIKEGLYAESTDYERRKSLVKLQVLKEILGPKIDRADITALEGCFPPKVEFVITVPLTQLQKQAYDAYVESVLQGKEDANNAKLWSWLAILGLCCNHPTCFRDKLQSRADDAAKAAKDSVDAMPGDEPIAQAGLPEGVVTKEEELFAAVSDMKALDLSYRAQILDQIVALSIKAGDKVLVFSHSLPTLNYIEHVLQVSGHKYCRLDGRTPMQGRQTATKEFNTGYEHMVYLISTRAGGLGLNIAGANRVVIFDFKFSPMWEEQAVGRAYRLGQQKPVFVYRFMTGGTFEEVINNKAVFKTQLAFRVVDKKNPIRWASKSLREYLFPAKPVKQTDVSEYIGKDPRVLDQIIKHDQGSIRKIGLTETFQREGDDALTEDDQRDVQQQLSDERLKRSDPEAYERLMNERRPQPAQPIRAPASGPYPSWPTMLQKYQTSSLPLSTQNVALRALPPDFSATSRPLNSVQAFPSAQASYTALYPAFQAVDENSQRPQSQPPAQTGTSQPNPSAQEPNQQPNLETPIQKATNNSPSQREVEYSPKENGPSMPLDKYVPEAPEASLPDGYTTAPTTPSST